MDCPRLVNLPSSKSLVAWTTHVTANLVISFYGTQTLLHTYIETVRIFCIQLWGFSDSIYPLFHHNSKLFSSYTVQFFSEFKHLRTCSSKSPQNIWVIRVTVSPQVCVSCFKPTVLLKLVCLGNNVVCRGFLLYMLSKRCTGNFVCTCVNTSPVVICCLHCVQKYAAMFVSLWKCWTHITVLEIPRWFPHVKNRNQQYTTSDVLHLSQGECSAPKWMNWEASKFKQFTILLLLLFYTPHRIGVKTRI